MTGFELLEALTKTDAEYLREEIYAGMGEDDRIVDVYIEEGMVTLLTEGQRTLDAQIAAIDEKVYPVDSVYWNEDVKREEARTYR